MDYDNISIICFIKNALKLLSRAVSLIKVINSLLSFYCHLCQLLNKNIIFLQTHCKCFDIPSSLCDAGLHSH
jgi:hypothetical protein